MGVNSLALPLKLAFANFRQLLGNPVVYVVPRQTPAGLTYDSDVDAWVDGDGDVVTRQPAELTYYQVPALWGSDSSNMLLALGGILGRGDLVAVALAEHRSKFDAAMEVVTGTLTGNRYVVAGLENAPDGGAPVFVVAQLRRK